MAHVSRSGTRARQAMRALRYHHYGSPEALRIDELPEPSPAAGHAKIRVHTAGLNAIDWKILAGHVRFVPVFRSPPRGVGFDLSGEIAGIGGGGTSLYVGAGGLCSL